MVFLALGFDANPALCKPTNKTDETTMPLLTYSGKTLYYAHCPKAGGTSVEEFLSQYAPLSFHDRRWFKRWTTGQVAKTDIPNSPQHLTWRDFQALHKADPDEVFAVVRDPMDRIISEFYFQCKHRPAIRWIARFGFSVWLRAMLRAQRSNAYLADNHIRPQTEFAPSHAAIFYLEDGMVNAETFVVHALGGLEKANSIGHTQVRRHKKRGRAPGINLSVDDVRLVRSFYAADYERFGYSDPNEKALRRDPLAGCKDVMASVLSLWILRMCRQGKI